MGYSAQTDIEIFAVGNTVLGIQSIHYQVMIAVTHVPELNILRVKTLVTAFGLKICMAILENKLACMRRHASDCSAGCVSVLYLPNYLIRPKILVKGNFLLTRD